MCERECRRRTEAERYLNCTMSSCTLLVQACCVVIFPCVSIFCLLICVEVAASAADASNACCLYWLRYQFGSFNKRLPVNLHKQSLALSRSPYVHTSVAYKTPANACIRTNVAAIEGRTDYVLWPSFDDIKESVSLASQKCTSSCAQYGAHSFSMNARNIYGIHCRKVI